MKILGIIITNFYVNFTNQKFNATSNIATLARAMAIIQKFQDAGAQEYLTSPFFVDRLFEKYKDDEKMLEKIRTIINDTKDNKSFMEKITADEQFNKDLAEYMNWLKKMYDENDKEFEVSFSKADLQFLKNILDNTENPEWGTKKELAEFYTQILKELGE